MLLYSKGNNPQSKKTTYRMGEYLFYSSDRDLISKSKNLTTKEQRIQLNELNRQISKEVQMSYKYPKNVQHH
jgi:hypothetical protein